MQEPTEGIEGTEGVRGEGTGAQGVNSLPAFTVEPLGEHHPRGAFCCGHEGIDGFFNGRALKDHLAYKVRIRAAICADSKQVMGFYSLAIGALEARSLRGPIGRKFGKWPIPVVYLAAIAVREGDVKKGIGTTLMLDAFEKASKIADLAGTACMTLDAVDEEKARWYEGLQFQRFAVTEDSKIRMFIPIATIQDALA